MTNIQNEYTDNQRYFEITAEDMANIPVTISRFESFTSFFPEASIATITTSSQKIFQEKKLKNPQDN